MRYFTALILTLLFGAQANSQTYEVGLYAGGSNFIGDVGKTNYIDPDALVIGGIAKWNRSARHAFRASILFANLQASDLESDDLRRQNRGYHFSSSFIEGSLGIEYTFWDFDMHSSFNRPASPYLYTGLTGFYHDSFALDAVNNTLVKTDRELDLAIPMVLGFKAQVSSSFVLGIEVGARYTFIDNLDGSFPGDEDLGGVSFGNINNNDWYMFSGLTITYTFGRQPCYCGF